MLYKKDYKKFISELRELLTKYDKNVEEKYYYFANGYYIFYISTPYGKLRVAVAGFVPKREWDWILHVLKIRILYQTVLKVDLISISSAVNTIIMIKIMIAF